MTKIIEEGKEILVKVSGLMKKCEKKVTCGTCFMSPIMNSSATSLKYYSSRGLLSGYAGFGAVL